MPVQRKTRVVQELRIEVDLGPLPESKKIETIRIQRKTDGGVMRVNRVDMVAGGQFPPDDFLVMEDIDPDEGIDAGPVSTVREETSLYTRDELATMPIKNLRKLPEFTRLGAGAVKKLRTKDDYVKALVGVRESESSGVARAAL